MAGYAVASELDSPDTGGPGLYRQGQAGRNRQVTPFVHNLSVADCVFLIQFCVQLDYVERYKLL